MMKLSMIQQVGDFDFRHEFIAHDCLRVLFEVKLIDKDW